MADQAAAHAAQTPVYPLLEPDGDRTVPRARAAIRRATREAAKAQYGGLGRQIVERACARAGRKFSERS